MYWTIGHPHYVDTIRAR